ncbi:MAG: very short patch repair endonuclease [Bacteroidales bacterium]|nr:very short patch repair endonuclease [Bacteroidales bacterium]
MTDVLTPQQRRRCMQANRGRNTKIEQLIAHELYIRNIRYRRNDRTVFGRPDFCFKGLKIAVFCDGVFWHGRDYELRKESLHLKPYWAAKIERNIARDHLVNTRLAEEGWQVLRLWEDEIRQSPSQCADRIEHLIAQQTTARLRRIYQHDTQYDTLLFAAEEDAPYGDN